MTTTTPHLTVLNRMECAVESREPQRLRTAASALYLMTFDDPRSRWSGPQMDYAQSVSQLLTLVETVLIQEAEEPGFVALAYPVLRLYVARCAQWLRLWRALA